jgi:hypothetical protein
MIGMTFDSVGGLYLAYDLLGGPDGPLSRLTRAVNYSLLFFIIYLLGFNFKFALIGGIGLGTATALHLHRISHTKQDTASFLFWVGLLRGVTVAWACSYIISNVASLVAGIGVFLVSFVLPLFKLSPRLWYEPSVRPTISKKKIIFALVLGALVSLTIVFGEFLGGDKHALHTAFRAAFVITLGTVVISTFSPMIEWYSDNVPDKRMGYIGAVMFLCGFVIQAIPSLMVLLHY